MQYWENVNYNVTLYLVFTGYYSTETMSMGPPPVQTACLGQEQAEGGYFRSCRRSLAAR